MQPKFRDIPHHRTLSQPHDTHDPDNIYFNAVIDGPKEVELNQYPGPSTNLAEFSVTRTVPIISRCSDYYASIIRFAIPLDNVPILIVPVFPNSGLTQQTPWIVGITMDGVNYTQTNPQGNAFINWVPSLYGFKAEPSLYGFNATPSLYGFNAEPVNQNQTTQIITPFYYLHSYNELISLVNEALSLAFAAFIAANPGAPQAAFPAPFFIYNEDDQLISLIAHNTWATTQAQAVLNPPGIPRVFINSELTVYFDGLRVIFNTSPPAETRIVVQNYGNNGYPTNTYPAVPDFLRVTQAFNTINYWSSLRKIVITTNTLPIVSEAIPSGDSNTGVSANQPILSDFIPELTKGGDGRSVAYYNPGSQYKLVNMIQDIMLQKIDLKIFWQDKDNNLYPLLISKNQQASIKIGFFRKTLYNLTGINAT